MNLSIKSCKNFIIINSFLLFLGFIEYYSDILCYYYLRNHYIYRFLCILFLHITRNYILVFFIDNGTKDKPLIQSSIYSNNRLDIPKEDYPFEFHIHLCSTTTIEYLTYIFITYYLYEFHIYYKYLFIEWIYFMPLSFFFEIVFDFFHYITHRMLHHKCFYKYLHKKHHKFNHPISMTTFYQHPIDLLITNSIPTILALKINPFISRLQFHWIIIYKNFIEISGHSGNISYPTSSFSQFLWLPKLLMIELYAEDHDLHHSENNCNYSKRFCLWDKLFNTYTSFQHKKKY